MSAYVFAMEARAPRILRDSLMYNITVITNGTSLVSFHLAHVLLPYNV